MVAITPLTMDCCEDWLANPCEVVETPSPANGKSKGHLLELAGIRELAPVTCNWAETQSQAEGWESFVVEEREGFSCVLIDGCWHRDAGGPWLVYITGFLRSWS